MRNKKAQMQWWIIALIIALVALVLILAFYYSLYGKSEEGLGLISQMMQL